MSKRHPVRIPTDTTQAIDRPAWIVKLRVAATELLRGDKFGVVPEPDVSPPSDDSIVEGWSYNAHGHGRVERAWTKYGSHGYGAPPVPDARGWSGSGTQGRLRLYSTRERAVAALLAEQAIAFAQRVLELSESP